MAAIGLTGRRFTSRRCRRQSRWRVKIGHVGGRERQTARKQLQGAVGIGLHTGYLKQSHRIANSDRIACCYRRRRQ